MATSKQLLVALLLGALAGPVHGTEGDVLAATDFRSGTQDWSLKGLGTAMGWSSEGLQSEGDVIAAIDSPADTGRTWYYAAPKAFLGGDKALAYNGWLVFNFGHFEYESMGLPAIDGYDVYLQAKNKKFTLGLKGVFKMDDNKLSNTYSVRLEEDFMPPGSQATWELVNVVKPVDGKLVTQAPSKHEFITCLQTLSGIWIRGSYFKGSEASWLKDVKIIQGAVNKGGNPLGATSTLVNGSLVYGDKTAPPTASSTCCASRTCVSNDKYEISFDRPGCMHSSDMYCCMTNTIAADSCSKYPVTYEKSKAAEVIRGTDHNEGRAFFLPGTVDKCQGAGTGQHGAKFSSCHTHKDPAGQSILYGQRRASWGVGTKNQNMGIKAIPIQKPFVKDYYMGSIPRICSPATLTVEAHGDLADSKDSIMVYGEDEVYLGTIFAGNLTYLKQGQRPYDAYGAATDCAGKFDPNIANSGENARLADPHHPSGNRPQHKGYRGGRNDVVTPGVQGKEDTHCQTWQTGGKHPLSLQDSESQPYIDTIAISQDRMMQYSADGQIKFTFRSVRDDSQSNAFSGTGEGGATRFCSFYSESDSCGTATKCEGCDLDGKVIFRSIRLKFSAGVCYTKKAATDYSFEYIPQIHTPQNLNISVIYSVPSGESGQPGGDAALSLTVGADIFGTDKKLVVYDKDLNKVGELFARESFQSLRSHMHDDAMVMTTSFGAKDAPTPFHLQSNCDTTSPILGTDKCTPADNQWTMKSTLVNYTDTLRIPRETIAKMAVGGKVHLYITADVPANAFSLSAAGKARFSPITLAYPLMHCFMKAIKTGPNFGIFLDRPSSYYFKETGFPMPAGDVTVFVAASWQQHVRYVTRHIGAAVSNKFSYDGVEDGLPVMRVDKDTVADMGTVWVYKNSDGRECCPSTLRPAFADSKLIVNQYSNCMGAPKAKADATDLSTGDCEDPTLDSSEGCTEEAPCAKGVIAATSDATKIVTTDATIGALARDTNNYYVGMKVVLYAKLKAANPGPLTVVQPNANNLARSKKFKLKVTGGGGGGAKCQFETDANGIVDTTKAQCTALGAYQWTPTVSLFAPGEPDHPASYGLAHGYCHDATGCTLPTFTATLEDTGTATTSLGGVVVETALPSAATAGAYTITLTNAFTAVDVGYTLVLTDYDTVHEYTITARNGDVATVTPPLRQAYTTSSTFRIRSNYRRIARHSLLELFFEQDASTLIGGNPRGSLAAAPVAGTNVFRISADDEGGTTAFPRNQRDGSFVGGTTAVRVDPDVVCQTRVFKTGTVEHYLDADKTAIRLDAEASLFDTAYNGYTIRVQKESSLWHTTTVSKYAGTVSGMVAAADTNTLTVSLTAASAPVVTQTSTGISAQSVAASAGNDIGLGVQALSSQDDAYNGVMIEIDIDGDATTSDDTYVRKIHDYANTNKEVTLKIPLIKRTVASGIVSAATSTTVFRLGAAADGVASEVDDAYNTMYMLIDLDGYPETENDIEWQQISDYTGSTREITLGAALTATPTTFSTWTIVASLRDLDRPTASSSFRIYSRELILTAALTDVVMTKGTTADEPIGADAIAGALQVTLGGTASTTAGFYRGMKLRILSDGLYDEYTITNYGGADKVAQVSPALRRSYEATASATYNIFRVYEIYEDLGASCLENVNMTVTYTYGTAQTISNDPGKLSTIYSNWDRESARAMGAADLPEQRDVRAWTLKLAGQGYYDNLYTGEGLSSYDNNANKASGAQIATAGCDATCAGGAASPLSNYAPAGRTALTDLQDPFATLTLTATAAGLQVGQYIKLTDGASSEKYEVLKVVAKLTPTTVAVQRAQLGTIKQTFAAAVHYVYTVGFNRGQGMDEMAELGGRSRYSSDYNDAYTGLWVTIVAGTGAGQTRWISDYHGDSRTVYLGGSPWSTIPDATSKYKIWYSAEIVEHVADKLVYASYPRPVKKGYLIEFHWFGCSKDVPDSLLNNAWTGTTTRTLRQNYQANQARSGLPQCKGQLGMRKPKQGPVKVYPRFKVLETDYVTGLVKAVGNINGLTKAHLTLDSRAYTDPGVYVGRKIIVKNGATVQGTATIMQSFLGGKATEVQSALTPNTEFRFVEVYLDQTTPADPTTGSAWSAAAGDTYTITPADGVSGSTTISEVGQNGEQYTMEEVDVVRYEYPELIEQHREWPHGYSYLQMKAGADGEHVGNLFLKDYTQYSTESYYTDSITIPRSVFENYVKPGPNGVSGEFPFTLKTPPGKGNIELLSIVIGYPVLKQEDASSYDSTDIETARKSSHGPPPFFPYSPGWSGVDESARTTRTHPRFQTHAYTSTCGNGVHDAEEYCDDGNHVDGDGCSSACSLEAGWSCETVSLRAPSICRKGSVGSRVPDQEIGCKFYTCEPPAVRAAGSAFGPPVTGPPNAGNDVDTWKAAFNNAAKNPTGVAGRAIVCSGTPTDGIQTFYGVITGGAAVPTSTYAGDAGGLAVNPYGPHFPICKLDGIQGTCTQCVTWDTSDSAEGNSDAHATNNDQTGITGGLLQDSGVRGYDGSSKRRRLLDDSATASSSLAPEGEDTETVTL